MQLPAMANTPNRCNICWQPTRPFNKTLKCSTCQTLIHIKCLPYYQTDDIEYAKLPENQWSCTLCLKILFPFFESDNTLLQTNNSVETIYHDIDQLNNLPNDIMGMQWDEEGDIMEDIDPDTNYYNSDDSTNPNNCLYYHPNGLNLESAKHSAKESLSIFHVNIRSLRKNFSKLVLLLDSIDNKFNLIILTETWLKSHNADLFKIEGYDHEHITRSTTGGGVSIYIKENLNYKTRTDLNYHDPTLDMLWLEISNLPTTQRSTLLGAIYKAPCCETTKLIDKLQFTTDIANKENKILIHAGDYNLDLIKSETHLPTSEFLELNLASSILP
jgi:hypothetical protein